MLRYFFVGVALYFSIAAYPGLKIIFLSFLE